MKILRKQLGEDKLIINIKSKKPETLNVKIIDVATKKVLSSRVFIAKKKIETLTVNLPYRDYVLRVGVRSISGGNNFMYNAYLKSDKFYNSVTGNKPMSKFFSADATGLSMSVSANAGGGNLAVVESNQRGGSGSGGDGTTFLLTDGVDTRAGYLSITSGDATDFTIQSIGVADILIDGIAGTITGGNWDVHLTGSNNYGFTYVSNAGTSIAKINGIIPITACNILFTTDNTYPVSPPPPLTPLAGKVTGGYVTI